MTKISVIMGAYNVAKDEGILDKAMQSILNQTFSDFEFIICDDGSDDCTYELLKKYEALDTRIVLLKNEKNMGLAKTLNVCLSHAKANFIARMDADDFCNLSRFEKQYNYLVEHLECDVVSTDAIYFDGVKNVGKTDYNKIIDKKDFLFNSPVIHASIMARKSAYDLVENYSEENYAYRVEDYDLFMRMKAKGVNFHTLKEPLYYIREDINTFKRRKYKYRINEFKVRWKGFKNLGILFPKGVFYLVKPLVVGLLPASFMKKRRAKRIKSIEE